MNHSFLPTIYLLLTLLTLTECSVPPRQTSSNSPNQPSNIILLIGDGMGLSQLSTAYYYADSTSNFSRFPVVGLLNTSSKKEKITDSAAGATAFATGQRTYNGAISLDIDSNTIPTLIETLSKQGMNTGLVATSSITHATPACFYAHTIHRSMEEAIAEQLVTSDVDFFAGGGLQFFTKRSDGQNLIDSLSTHGFTIATSDSKLEKQSKKLGYLLADNGLPKANKRNPKLLAQLTKKSTEFLSSKDNGFFLMVEGSQIDWGGHANDADWLISEVLDFDKAVGAALDVAEKDGKTLVIVTADHETGGFALAGTDTTNSEGKTIQNYANISPLFSTHGHTTSLVPVLAYGPNSALFSGIYNNTEIHKKILQSLPLSAKQNH